MPELSTELEPPAPPVALDVLELLPELSTEPPVALDDVSPPVTTLPPLELVDDEPVVLLLVLLLLLLDVEPLEEVEPEVEVDPDVLVLVDEPPVLVVGGMTGGGLVGGVGGGVVLCPQSLVCV